MKHTMKAVSGNQSITSCFIKFTKTITYLNEMKGS